MHRIIYSGVVFRYKKIFFKKICRGSIIFSFQTARTWYIFHHMCSRGLNRKYKWVNLPNELKTSLFSFEIKAFVLVLLGDPVTSKYTQFTSDFIGATNLLITMLLRIEMKAQIEKWFLFKLSVGRWKNDLEIYCPSVINTFNLEFFFLPWYLTWKHRNNYVWLCSDF